MKANRREVGAGGGTRYQPMVLLCVACALGMGLDRGSAIPPLLWAAGAAVGIGLWYLALSRRGGWLGTAAILLSVAGTGALWHHLRWSMFPRDDVGLCATDVARPACFEAYARSSPRWQPAPHRDPLCTMPVTDESQLVIEVIRVRDGTTWQRGSGQALLIVAGRLSGIRTGDRLRVLASLSTSRRPLNPGENDATNYDRSLRRLCRFHADSSEYLTVVERGKQFGPAVWLSWVRDRCDAYLWRYIRHPRAGLAAAVLLGAREEVDRDRQDDYMTTGTIHLLSISGLHLAILAYGFWMTARLGVLSRRVSLVIAVIFAATYAAFTDAQPPVVRAAVLVIVVCVARWLIRPSLNFNTLAVAGLVVLALNPASLFQTGAQLSFLAVATMSVMPWFLRPMTPADDPLLRLIAETRSLPERILRRVLGSIGQALVLSTVIWLIALPLVAYRFHVVSPIATVLNPIVCLPMSVALFAGFGVMVLGWFAPPLAAISGWICDFSLQAMEWTIFQALRIPGNHFWVPAPPGWWVVAFYSVLAVWMAVPGLRPPSRWLWAFLLGWTAWGGYLTVGPAGRVRGGATDPLTCTFVSVGHGTSVLVEFPDGKTMLYDAGRLGSPMIGTRAISNVLWSRGIMHLDAVVISHADADHFNALPDLLERFSVGTLYVGPTMFDGQQEAVSALSAAVGRHQVDVRTLSRGDRLQTGAGCDVHIMHPPPHGIAGSDNANSIVLLVEYSGCKLLLPGDLESPGTELLLAQAPLDSDVIMAPHHGSLRSDPEGFVHWSTPEDVVISGGAARAGAAVQRAYQAAGNQVWHTALDGAVEVTIQSGEITMRSFRRRGPYGSSPPSDLFGRSDD